MHTMNKFIRMGLISASFLLVNSSLLLAEDDLISTVAGMAAFDAEAEARAAILDAIDEEGPERNAFSLPQQIVESESDELAAKINQALLDDQKEKVARCNHCNKYRTVYRTKYRTVTRRKSYMVRKRRTRTVRVARRRTRVSFVPVVRYRTVLRPVTVMRRVRVRYRSRRRVRRHYTTYVPRRRVYYTNVRRTRLIRRRVGYRTKTVYRRNVSYSRVRSRTRRVRTRTKHRRRHRSRNCRHFY